MRTGKRYFGLGGGGAFWSIVTRGLFSSQIGAHRRLAKNIKDFVGRQCGKEL